MVAPGDHRILVVDDNSPDGTGTLADQLAEELDAVEVLHRQRKDGLGRAYLAGFEHALAGGAELVIEMDADFSHDPKLPGRAARGAPRTPTWCSARGMCPAAPSATGECCAS